MNPRFSSKKKDKEILLKRKIVDYFHSTRSIEQCKCFFTLYRAHIVQ